MFKCTICKDKKAKFKLWQRSKNKYENFCNYDCLKIYTYKKYTPSLARRAFYLAKECVEDL